MKRMFCSLALLLFAGVSAFANDVVIKNNTGCPFTVVLNSGSSVFVPRVIIHRLFQVLSW